MMKSLNTERLTMKGLPETERPYERCEQVGPGGLSDAELLAMILQSGTKTYNAKEIACLILASDTEHPGLEGLLRMSIQELQAFPGIGRVKALQIKAICELATRITRIDFRKGSVFNTPEAVADYYMGSLQHLEQEELHMMILDSKKRLLATQMITRGTVNAAMIDPREIFIRALNLHAVSIILIHNHPSGDSSPSNEDILATDRIRQAGDLLGIPLIDHLIIGHQGYTSLRQIGCLT